MTLEKTIAPNTPASLTILGFHRTNEHVPVSVSTSRPALETNNAPGLLDMSQPAAAEEVLQEPSWLVLLLQDQYPLSLVAYILANIGFCHNISKVSEEAHVTCGSLEYENRR